LLVSIHGYLFDNHDSLNKNFLYFYAAWQLGQANWLSGP
jgi:hypothetical protein